MKIKIMILTASIALIAITAFVVVNRKNISSADKDASAGDSASKTNFNAEKRGARNADLFNGGEVNFTDGFIYFKDANNDFALSKMKADGTEKTMLNKDRPKYINVVDGYVYYLNEIDFDTRSICRCKIDGSEPQTLVSSEADINYLIVYNDRMYYLRQKTDETKEMCSCNLRGEDSIVLNENCWCFNIYKNFIYYTKNDSMVIFKADLEAKNEQAILDDESFSFIEDDKFFCEQEEGRKINAIYYLDLISFKKQELSKTDKHSSFNIDRDYLYSALNDKVMKTNLKTKQQEVVLDRIDLIQVSYYPIRDFLYCIVDPNGGMVYKIKKDGSETNYVNNNWWPDKFPLVITASSGKVNTDHPFKNEFNDNVWTLEGDSAQQWCSIDTFRKDDNGQKIPMAQCFCCLYVYNGNGQSEEAYYANNRIKKIKVELSDGTSIIKDLQDEYKSNETIDFGKYVETSSIKITILEVYKGSSSNAKTYLNDVEFIASLFDFGDGALGGI